MNDSFDLYRPKLPPTFGTAEWANLKDLRLRRMLEVGLGKNMGPLLGCLTPAEIGGHELRYIYANGDFHLVSFGTTGSGKNRGQILTNLLWYEGSMVVLDFKGENNGRLAAGKRAPRPSFRTVRWSGLD